MIIKENKYRPWIWGLVVLLAYTACFLPGERLIRLTDEDGLFENLGALLFLLTAISFFFLAFNIRNFKYSDLNKPYRERYIFIFLALVFFFAFGEEISWGQRIIGFDTPDVVDTTSSDGEFNLHDLEVFNGLNWYGESNKNGIMSYITISRIFIVLLTTFLFLIPVAYNVWPTVRKWLNRLHVPISPMWIGVLFVLNILLFSKLFEQIVIGAGKFPLRYCVVEIREYNYALILFLLALTWINWGRIFPDKGEDNIGKIVNGKMEEVRV